MLYDTADCSPHMGRTSPERPHPGSGVCLLDPLRPSPPFKPYPHGQVGTGLLTSGMGPQIAWTGCLHQVPSSDLSPLHAPGLQPCGCEKHRPSYTVGRIHASLNLWVTSQPQVAHLHAHTRINAHTFTASRCITKKPSGTGGCRRPETQLLKGLLC